MQEDFIVTGGSTLENLDDYIRACDGLIHLVGKATGDAPEEHAVAALLRRYPDFRTRLPPLAPALSKPQPGFFYTQAALVPPGPMHWKLKDAAVEALLKGLPRRMRGFARHHAGMTDVAGAVLLYARGAARAGARKIVLTSISPAMRYGRRCTFLQSLAPILPTAHAIE